MTRFAWKSAALCTALFTSLTLPAQNATSGGDQQAQPDAQTRAQNGGQRGPGGARRGGAVRGTVTAVKGNDVVVKNEGGETWTVISTDNTRVRRDNQPGTVAAVQVGDEVVAMGMPDVDKHEVHAMMLMDVSAAEVAKAKANMGKTYIVGRVTAIDDTKLTILRPDKVSQTINLDETTSLHRGGRMNGQAMAAMTGMDMGGGMGMGGPGGGMGMGDGQRRGGNVAAPGNDEGEAITLADVKVGDTVGGTGSLKGGVFVPTDLRVANRPAGGGRRGPGGEGAPPPPQ